MTHSSTPTLSPHVSCGGFTVYRNSSIALANGFSSIPPFSSLSLRTSVIVAAKKNNNNKKSDNHSFVSKPDEATGPFPEAVLLKQKKVQEDGRLLPEFADSEEQELYESLNLQLESALNVDRVRHYEVVYLIHENHAEEVESVNLIVQDFLREKKGKVWRFSDWGLRKLAYKIQKAKNAHYILMNFELEAKWINDFKRMLDTDERVIRHLVIKRDEAITEDCPPPIEFHTLRAGSDNEEDDIDYDDEDDDEDEDLDEDEEGIIYVDEYEEDGEEIDNESLVGSSTGRRKLEAEKVSS